jgi:hypothetical protein
MTVGQLSGYLKEHWLTIREQLLNGIYEPQPVRRVEIEKPDGGGMRKLGIPTILDRFLQQAVMQVLQRQAMQQSRDEIGRSRGVTCFSAHWHDPVIWAHYSDKHRGICLGFEVREDKAKRVNYVTERLPFPTAPPITIDHAEAMLFTKYDSWKYEQELRIWATLEEEEDGLYFKDFDDELRLVEVIVGARCTVPRSAIVRALAPLTTEISLVKARAGFTKFEIVTDQRGLK